MSIKFWLLATALLLLGCVGYSVDIQADAACSGLASNDVQTLWLGTGENCNKVDDGLITPLNSIIKSAPNRFNGQCLDDYISTLMSELKKVMYKCGNECSEVVKGAADISADIFYAVSEEIGHTEEFSGLEDLICSEYYKISRESSIHK